MTRRTIRLLVPVAFALLVGLVPGGGVEAGLERCRFTSGLHLDVDGEMRSLYVEGPALDAPPDLEKTEVRLTLDLDVAIRLGTKDMSRGRYGFHLHLDGKKPWLLVPDRGAVRKDRLEMTMTEGAPHERDLVVRFVRAEGRRKAALVAAWGSRRGRIEVLVDPGSVPVSIQPTEIDETVLRDERTRLLAAAGDVQAALNARGRWVRTLAGLRAGAVTKDGVLGLRYRLLKSKSESDTFSLVVDGWTTGRENKEIGRLQTRLTEILGETWTRVDTSTGDWVKDLNGRILRCAFQLTVNASLAKWHPGRVGLASSGDWRLRDEIGFLDHWMQQTAAADKGVTNMRDRVKDLVGLCAASDVSLGRVSPIPFHRRDGDLVSRYRVSIEVRGPYDGLITLLDGIHGWGCPLWIEIDQLEEAARGVSAKIRLEFLSYVPLSIREPARWTGLAVEYDDPAFEAGATEYWSRMPRVKPYEEYRRPENAPGPFAPEKVKSPEGDDPAGAKNG